MNRPDKIRHFKVFYPPANWEDKYDTKEYSLYYELLVKQLGKQQADEIWDKREDWKNPDNEEHWYNLVKHYKPKNRLNMITDLSWGYESIKRLK